MTALNSLTLHALNSDGSLTPVLPAITATLAKAPAIATPA